jgi:5'-methylthioadenosine phosphorylase
MQADPPAVAVIGGSGLCQQDIFPVVDTVRPCRRQGEASGEISICAYTDAAGEARTVAFLPRHGAEHTLAPHQVPYRANIAALRALGVTQILATCIAGSLRRRVRPGDLVVPDQFVNLTWGRDPEGPVDLVHLPMADPYCPRLRAHAFRAGRAAGLRTHPRGTAAVIQGPRFSTRAESRWFSRQGWDLVNMTQYPECYLAREAGLCYAVLAMITDYDVGLGRHAAITRDKSLAPVLQVFHRNVEALRKLLAVTVPQLERDHGCGCDRPLAPEYYKDRPTPDSAGAGTA